RGLLERDHPSRRIPRMGALGDHRAAAPEQPGRDLSAALHAGGPGQGPVGADDALQPRAEERPHPGRHHPRPPVRQRAQRRGGCRGHLRPVGHRQLSRAGDPGQGHSRRPERGALHRGALHPHQPGRGPGLRDPGPQDPPVLGPLMSSTAPAFRPEAVGGRMARSLTQAAQALFHGDRFGVAALCFLVLVVVLAVLAPVIAPYDPVHITPDNLASPSLRHPFGTDQFGRDVMSRIVWGARLTLLAPVVGIGISTLVGVPLGLLAGYSNRWLSGLIMRVMDVMLAFPGLLLALIVVTIIGPGVVNVMVAIGIAFIPVFARVVYGSTLAVRGQDYVTAARSIGCRPSWLVTHHILPNLATQIIVIASSAVGWAILTATTLNFLGFGVKLPT